ncbi:MAG: hypothetical protein JWP91_1255 [Fibrobacteres bacterium]|nr:hypothetical protein [Fibrobacterota bacterium]
MALPTHGSLTGSPDGMNPKANEDIFVKSKGGGAGRSRKAVPEAVVEEDPPEALVEPPKAKPEPTVTLSNPAWGGEKPLFNEKISVSVQAVVPEEIAHLTRIEFKLIALPPNGKREDIRPVQSGHLADGIAKAEFTLYIPQYREDGKQPEECKYIFTAKHSKSKEIESPSVIAKAAAPKAPKVEVDVAGVAAAKKKTDGALVVRNFDGNGAPRKKFTVKKVVDPAGFAGSVLVQCASDKVKIFDAEKAGTQIQLDGSKNKFANASLPKDLWVEGFKASDAMADIEVSIDIVGGAAKADSFKLTVLWVDKPTVALAGAMSADNDKRDDYKNWTKAGTYALGLQDYNANYGARKGWGSEASAKVHPAAFKFAGNDLKLERDYYYRDYNGNAIMDKGDYTANPPPGNDTGPANARDDNPDPNGIIYDWDAAGLGIPDKPKGTILRTRNNFKAFASITVEGKSVRCSEVREYRIRFSQQQTKDPHGAEWKVINPPDLAGDNEAAHGTTNVTWDLK